MRRLGPRLALLTILLLVTIDSIGLPVAIIAFNHAQRGTAKTSEVCKQTNATDAILVSEIVNNIPVVLQGLPPAARPVALARMQGNAAKLAPKRC